MNLSTRHTGDNLIDSIPSIGWFKSQIKLPHTTDKRAMIYRLLNSNISKPIYSRLISSYEKHDDIRDIASELKTSKNKVRKFMSDFEYEVNDILLNPYLDHSKNEIYKDYEVAKSEILASHLEFSSSLIDNEASRSMTEEENKRPFYETLSFNQIIDSWQAYQARNRYY